MVIHPNIKNITIWLILSAVIVGVVTVGLNSLSMLAVILAGATALFSLLTNRATNALSFVMAVILILLIFKFIILNSSYEGWDLYFYSCGFLVPIGFCSLVLGDEIDGAGCLFLVLYMGIFMFSFITLFFVPCQLLFCLIDFFKGNAWEPTKSFHFLQGSLLFTACVAIVPLTNIAKDKLIKNVSYNRNLFWFFFALILSVSFISYVVKAVFNKLAGNAYFDKMLSVRIDNIQIYAADGANILSQLNAYNVLSIYLIIVVVILSSMLASNLCVLLINAKVRYLEALNLEKQDWLLLKSYPRLLCSRHFTKPLVKKNFILFNKLRCRSSHDCQSKYHSDYDSITGVIGPCDRELDVRHKVIYIRIWNDLKNTITNADIDCLNIVNGLNSDYDRVVNEAINALKNDSGRSGSWLKKVRVVIKGNPPLSGNTINMLSKEFKSVKYETG